jgi:ribose 5-phosphate isomerase RpiB
MTFYTARQLEDLHKLAGGNGHVLLPYRARLTPAAQDWVRMRKVSVGYGDAQPTPAAVPADAKKIEEGAGGRFLWWCDGPCGPAKAALSGADLRPHLKALDTPADARQTAAAIKAIAAEIKAGKADGAVLVVSAGATAMVLANRCPSIRAVLGTCIESVEQGIRLMAANVLVVEHPHRTMQQVRNMLVRFVKAKRDLSEETRRLLQEMATCA